MDRKGDIDKVKKAIIEGLRDYAPEVYVERCPETEYLHVWVISDAFEKYSDMKRMNIVGEVLENALTGDPIYPTITLVLPYTNPEFAESDTPRPLAFYTFADTAATPKKKQKVQWLDKVSIKVSDVKKARTFYEALGIPVSINAARKNSLLVLKQLDQSGNGSAQGLDYISFLTTYSHLKEMREYLKERNVKVHQQNSNTTIQLSFLDLDGNMIKIKAVREIIE